MSMIKNNIMRVLWCCLLALIFSSGQVNNPDTQLRIAQSMQLYENHTLILPDSVGDNSHGNIIYSNNGKFSVYNPGQILLITIPYSLTSLIGSYDIHSHYITGFIFSFFNLFIYGLIIFLFYDIGGILGINKTKKLIVTLIFGFSSYVFSHAQSTYEHVIEAYILLLLLKYLLLIKHEKCIQKSLLIGLFFGIGILFRSSFILLFPILFIVKKGNYKYIALTLSLFVAIILIYNYYRTNSVFDTGYFSAWEIAFPDKHPFFSFSYIPRNVFLLLFSPAKGLFIFSPSLLLIFLLLYKTKINKNLLRIVIYSTSLYFIVYASNFAWHGSAWCWGPRYIVPVIPLLYLLLFYVNFKKVPKIIVITIVFFSTFIQIIGISIPFKRDLLEIYNNDGDVFWEEDYYKKIHYSPLLGQIRSFNKIKVKVNDSLSYFIPKGSWKNESRDVSIHQMLDRSVEMNTWNFWWYRSRYFNEFREK